MAVTHLHLRTRNYSCSIIGFPSPFLGQATSLYLGLFSYSHTICYLHIFKQPGSICLNLYSNEYTAMFLISYLIFISPNPTSIRRLVESLQKIVRPVRREGDKLLTSALTTRIFSTSLFTSNPTVRQLLSMLYIYIYILIYIYIQ
jgi:hypothetical protein